MRRNDGGTMRGEKTVTFDEPFRISENGVFTEVDNITLRAPGLGKRAVHFAMSSYVMAAINEMQRKRPELMKAQVAEASPLNVDDEDQPDGMGHNQPPKDNEQDSLAFWQMMQMGLGETFPSFADYVMKILTGAPKLATVGDGETPLTDAAWEAIEETHGMAGIDRICGTFVGFFMVSQKSPKRNGSAMPPSSSSRPRAVSKSSMRASSRSSN